jgi:hypothetical protein
MEFHPIRRGPETEARESALAMADVLPDDVLVLLQHVAGDVL